MTRRSSRDIVLRKTVFDIDDTIWAYTYQVAKLAGIPYDDWIDFHTLNPKLTQAQKEAATAAYHSVEPFRNMVFYDGLEDILRLEDYGAFVQFKSHSFAQELLDLKAWNLKDVLPQLRPEQLILSVTSVERNTEKEFDDDTFIIVDDNPYATAKSKAPHIIMPRTPWNQTEKARALLAHKSVTFVPSGDLRAVYRVIVELLSRPPTDH